MGLLLHEERGVLVEHPLHGGLAVRLEHLLKEALGVGDRQVVVHVDELSLGLEAVEAEPAEKLSGVRPGLELDGEANRPPRVEVRHDGQPHELEPLALDDIGSLHAILRPDGVQKLLDVILLLEEPADAARAWEVDLSGRDDGAHLILLLVEELSYTHCVDILLLHI